MTYDDAGSGTVLELPSERLHDYERLILQYSTLFEPSPSLRYGDVQYLGGSLIPWMQ
jgi:hypothetical protein